MNELSLIEDSYGSNCYRDLFKFLFPLVALKTLRDEPIKTDVFQDMENFQKNIPLPPNKFLYKAFPGMNKDENINFIVRPNFDTAYCIAYLDTKRSPVIINIPKITNVPDKYGGGSRFWSVQMMDAWTNTFVAVGKENNSKEGEYAITGPTWRENNNLTNPYAPETIALIIISILILVSIFLIASCIKTDNTVKNILILFILWIIIYAIFMGPRKWREIQESPTDFVWIIVRIQTNGPEDALNEVFPLQRKFTAKLKDEEMEQHVLHDYYNGMIVPKNQYENICDTNDDCNIDSRCKNGACEKYDMSKCAGPKDCPVNSYCDGVQHKCIFFKQCDKDLDCPHGKYCDENQTCQDETTIFNQQCLSNEMCKDTGFCDLNVNKCKAKPCNENDECPDTQICNVDKKLCESPKRKCKSTNDCPVHKYCTDFQECAPIPSECSFEDIQPTPNNNDCKCEQDCSNDENNTKTYGWCRNLGNKKQCVFSDDYYKPDGIGWCLFKGDIPPPEQCPDGYFCNYQKQCEPKPGTFCDNDTMCVNSTNHCDLYSKRCVDPTPCNSSSDCQVNENCNTLAIHNNGFTGVCKTIDCVSDSSDIKSGCKEGAYCKDNLCRPIVLDSCDTDNDCPNRNMFCNTENYPMPRCEYKQSDVDPITTDAVTTETNKIVFGFSAEYFYTLASYVIRNGCPLSPYDKFKKSLLEEIKIIPYDNTNIPFEWGEISAKTKLNLIFGFKGGKLELLKVLFRFLGEYTDRNKWINIRDIGDYGTDYDKRAAIAFQGLGANTGKTAVYMSCMKDPSINWKLIPGSTKLNGSKHSYKMVFDGSTCDFQCKKPPVKGFWSLTVYDSNGYVVQGTDIHTFGSRNDIHYEEDGSFIVYLSAVNDENFKNWLPIPKSEFTVLARFYYPDKTIIDGDWGPPSVQKFLTCDLNDAKKVFRDAFDDNVTTRAECVKKIGTAKLSGIKLDKLGCTEKDLIQLCPYP